MRFSKATTILVPTLINFNAVEIGAVLIPINRSEAEVGVTLTIFQKKKIKVRAVLVTILEKK
jgi:hypothetical protein